MGMSPSHLVTRSAGFLMAFSIPKQCSIREVMATMAFGGEHKTNMLVSVVVARRPDPENPDVLNEEELKQLRSTYPTSFACDPMIETRQSPVRSASVCSLMTAISGEGRVLIWNCNWESLMCTVLAF